MANIIAFNSSPRKNGNSSIMLDWFIEGAVKSGNYFERFNTNDIHINYCTGCLRCNILKHCSVTTDDWPEISKKIIEADVLVFASPVYFHHVTASLKKLIDRFRSFVQVQITEDGLRHIPHNMWKKHFVLLLSMGSPNLEDAKPVIELFNFITKILGKDNYLHILQGTRLVVTNQLNKTPEELKLLYNKLNLPKYLANEDYNKNQDLINKCYCLGSSLT